MTLNETIEEERLSLAEISVGTDHRLLRDRWLYLKRVLDQVAKNASPFSQKEQYVVVDFSNLKTPTNLKRGLLMTLLNDGVFDMYNPKSAVISSEPIREYFDGKIIIKDFRLFEKIRRQVSSFVSDIEEDGRNHFPSSYVKPTR